jgi:dTMP kinase
MRESVYIVIEGIDGAGKTTQAKAISEKIREVTRELTVELTEPQKLIGTVGDEIRHRLANGPEIQPWEAVGLFVADRLQLLRKDIEPALRQGQIVIQDRNWLSTCVYNGDWDDPPISAGADPPHAPSALWLALHHVKIMPKPDLVVLLDVDKKTAKERLLKRAEKTGKKLDQFDKDDKHDERRERYQRLVRLDGIATNKVTIDASRAGGDVTNVIWRYVSPLLKEKGRL